MTAETQFDLVKPVADAVLYEGYLLYPYRSSATKNQLRWQFGVLMPPAFAAGGSGERERMFVDFLAEPGPTAVAHVRLRFLQVQTRLTGSDAWQEAIEQEADVSFPISDLLAAERAIPITVPGGTETDGDVERTRAPLSAEVRASAAELPGPFGGVRIRLTISNTSTAVDADREAALRTALIACHAVLVLRDGRLISLLEPPEWAKPAVAGCRQDGAWPIMIGSPETRDMLLVSPIILDDYPSIAPESPKNLFDGTEIDEILTLRTLALTDEEKREARATDPRAKEIIDHVDDMPAELWDRLHGTVRYLRAVTGEVDQVPEFREPDTPWWNPAADSSVSPDTDSIVISGKSVAKGSRVTLRPGLKRADAQDMFLTGRTAVVQAVIFDVDDETHLAVTLENDPAAELELLQGRFRYFAPEEVEPL